MILEIALFFFFVLLISTVIVNIKPKNYPPAPAISFPVLGHFPYFANYVETGLHLLFDKWSTKISSPIISVDFAQFRGIVIKDPKLIREAFNTPQLCSRFHLPINLIRSGTDNVQRGIIFADGQNWVDQRRFILRHLRDFGFGKTSMENIIMDEAQELVSNLSKGAGQPISTQSVFNGAIINAIWTIVAGERFRHDDPKLLKLVQCVTQNLSETGLGGATIFMPWFSKLFPRVSGWQAYLDSFYITHNFIKKFVHSRKETHDENLITDFTASYIDYVNKMGDESSSFYGEEGIKNLVTVLDDLFSAGGETTSTTLTWLMAYLALHPNVQDKFYKEIENVLGKNRLPSLSDKSSMPYTEALILETLRMSSVVALGVFHHTHEEVNFNGYLIPKNTMVIANLSGVHHDPQIWGDPEKFRPERFLSPDEKTVKKHDALMPFSFGKRSCPGETLAKDELFLISTTISQKFKICPDSLNPPTMRQKVAGLVAVPFPHKIIFHER